jgi:hypothetical protein
VAVKRPEETITSLGSKVLITWGKQPSQTAYNQAALGRVHMLGCPRLMTQAGISSPSSSPSKWPKPVFQTVVWRYLNEAPNDAYNTVEPSDQLPHAS